jgi:enoyl-CoA hydratase/carnithine racemase
LHDPGVGQAPGTGRPVDAVIHRQRLSQRATSGRLWSMPKPTIAAIGGPAAGAGLSLALACDLRYAVPGAVLTTAFARVAFAGDYGGTWFLTRLVGSGKAKELYFFSERLSAEDAQRLGIVNAIFPPADFEREVMARARRLAEGPSIAYRYMKENLNRAGARTALARPVVLRRQAAQGHSRATRRGSRAPMSQKSGINKPTMNMIQWPFRSDSTPSVTRSTK